MKYLKTFERSFERSTFYKYLDEKDEDKIKIFVEKYIDDKKIMNKIDNLKLSDFKDAELDYKEIFEILSLNNKIPRSYSKGNIYFDIDDFCVDNNIISTTPAIRNSLGKIINEIYKKYNIKYQFKNKLEKKLIGLLEKNPLKYKKFFHIFEELPDNVKKACQWMLDSEKYNL